MINLILPPYKYSVCCSSVMVRNRKSTFHPLLQKIPYIGKIAVDQYFYFCDNSPFRLNKKNTKKQRLIKLKSLVKLDNKFGQSNILQIKQIHSEFYRYKGYCIYT